jgi:3-oxoacyl-(acyl-carrier-protein) synthase
MYYPILLGLAEAILLFYFLKSDSKSMENKTSFYIQGLGNISPQKTFDNSEFLNEIHEYNENVLSFVLPELKNYIHPVAMRRMSRLLRAGLAAAKICAQDAQLEMPDAIITASGYGAIGDTSNFLNEILDNGEKQLTPTFFMQSTYNTISGAIAMNMKCNNYNTTYAHRGFSFENALQDAMMQMKDDSSKRILLGAFDETNKEQHAIKQFDGLHKRKLINNLQLFQSDGQGTIEGEGTAFFTLGTQKTANSYAQLLGVKTIYRPEDSIELQKQIESLLTEHNLQAVDIDVVINGAGGDDEKDRWSNNALENVFAKKQFVAFKHLCGDYCTAASFGMWLGSKILHHQHIPEVVKTNHIENLAGIKNLLVLNHFWGKRYSLILLQKV